MFYAKNFTSCLALVFGRVRQEGSVLLSKAQTWSQQRPEHGREEFKALKKSYSKGFELAGKTMGIIGMGRIGQETAQIALGMGMKVLAVDPYVEKATLKMNIACQIIETAIETVPMADMLSHADIVSLHIPFTGQAVLAQSV